MKANNMNYFELYLAGKHGYSAFVKSETITDPDEALEKAVEKNIIPLEDAKDIAHGAGYAEERTEAEVANFAPRLIHLI